MRAKQIALMLLFSPALSAAENAACPSPYASLSKTTQADVSMEWIEDLRGCPGINIDSYARYLPGDTMIVQRNYAFGGHLWEYLILSKNPESKVVLASYVNGLKDKLRPQFDKNDGVLHLLTERGYSYFSVRMNDEAKKNDGVPRE